MNEDLHSRQRGLTLIELLVTIILAGIAFAAIVPVFVQALQVGQGDRARAVALSVAQDRMEKIRELGYEELTQANLESDDVPAFHFGLFGPTATDTQGSSTKTYDVTYAVTDVKVSATDSRVAYKSVSVTVEWRGPPYPHKKVTLATSVYRQSAGPRIVDAGVDPAKLDATNKADIVTTPVRVSYFVDEADLPAMEPKTVGAAPNQRTLQGRVEISVTPGQTYVVSYSAPSLSGDPPAGTVGRTGNEFYVYWAPSGGGNGVGDGYYSFSARAFSTLGYVGEASTLIGSMKVETGPPPPVNDLAGAASGSSGLDGVANITWTASIATDLDHYLVHRVDQNGVPTLIAGDPALQPGWKGTGLSDPGLQVGASYTYEVEAVDWVGKHSTVRSLTLPVGDASAIAPDAPTDLKADLSGNSAVLSWSISTSSNVAGYHVYVNDGTTTTLIDTIPTGSSMTTSYNQGAGVRYYTVKAYRPLSADSPPASVFPAYITGIVGGETWVRVSSAVPATYDISARINSAPNPYSKVKNLELWYLGPSGMTPGVLVGTTQATAGVAPVLTVTTTAWNGQPSGSYEFRWYWMKNNGQTSALTKKLFPCSGGAGLNTTNQVPIP